MVGESSSNLCARLRARRIQEEERRLLRGGSLFELLRSRDLDEVFIPRTLIWSGRADVFDHQTLKAHASQ